MPTVPSAIIEPVWEQFSALLHSACAAQQGNAVEKQIQEEHKGRSEQKRKSKIRRRF